MAITTRTLFDGEKKLITSHVDVADGSGATTKIIDVSALNKEHGNTGSACTKVTFNKIWFDTSSIITAPVQVQWDLSSGTQTPLLSLFGSGHFDFSSIGGIANPKESNYTGDIDVVTSSNSSAGESYTLICEWLKNYD